MNTELTVDIAFASLCPDLTPEEVDLLEASLTTEGCRDPIIVWANHNDTILDGHNRYRICKRFNVAFKTKALKFDSREEAINWIISNQLGRRNLSDAQKSYLRGRRYQAEKKAHGDRGPEKIDQNDPSSTSDRLAEEYNVSAPTIKRDAKFAEAVDKIADVAGPEAKQSILSGRCGLGKAAVIEAADLPPKKMARAIKEGKVHVEHNSGNNEWYTPAPYIEAAREVMGQIDCDPASSEVANSIVDAATFYTAEQDGLVQKWGPRVWMNPPYSQPLVANFAKAITDKHASGEVAQACVLVNNATETGWFQTMLEHATRVCFLKGRVKYLDPEGKPSGAPLQGQAILYFGDNGGRFTDEFSKFGPVLLH